MSTDATAPIEMSAHTIVAAAEDGFPELGCLAWLTNASWAFVPAVADGELVAIQGWRAWPNRWSDGIRILYVSEAMALRCDPAGWVTWRCEGTLVEVVNALLELPEPDDSPHLVIDRAPVLWAPGTSR